MDRLTSDYNPHQAPAAMRGAGFIGRSAPVPTGLRRQFSCTWRRLWRGTRQARRPGGSSDPQPVWVKARGVTPFDGRAILFGGCLCWWSGEHSLPTLTFSCFPPGCAHPVCVATPASLLGSNPRTNQFSRSHPRLIGAGLLFTPGGEVSCGVVNQEQTTGSAVGQR